MNNSNPSEIQKNRYSQLQDNESSIDIEKLNNLNSNIELLEIKIKQTRSIGNNTNQHNKNKSINIIQDYNENNFSKNPEYSDNYIHKDFHRDREIDYSNSKSFKNSNYDELNKTSVIKNINKRNPNNDLFYHSNDLFNSQEDGQEEIVEQDNHNLQKSYNYGEPNDNNDYQSRNNSYIRIEKKKNQSTSKLKNFSNLNIGYIPDELSRSPAMRKSIDRSKILRRDYGCYEKFRKSSNFESINNDYNQYENENHFENINILKNDLQNDSELNLSPERYLKNKNFNSSQNNSLYMNGSVTQNRNNRTNNRSPIRKELLFNNKKYEARSPLRINNEYSSKQFDNSNAFSNSNYNTNSYIFNDFKENLSIENIKNLSMFTVKSDHHKIKSQNLATFLYDLVIVDSLSESNKESLSLRTDISLRDLFGIFDISKRNSISLVDFQDTLKKLEIYVPLPELKLTFKRFDNDMDGRLE